jgi:branched-chain amino acid transport system ATP-binding protein
MVLERGRLVYDGPSATLREQPEILHGAYLAQ